MKASAETTEFTGVVSKHDFWYANAHMSYSTMHLDFDR